MERYLKMCLRCESRSATLTFERLCGWGKNLNDTVTSNVAR